jgi:hypothetical protein
MATRMQQRRGTALQWSTSNPVLAAGEIGFETDTSKFKIGNGSSTWTALTYFTNSAALTDLLNGAPDALNTLNELAAAIGDDPAFFTTVGTNLSNHISDETDIHGIADTSVLATFSYVTDAIASVTGDYQDLAGAGLAWNSEDEQFEIDNTVATKTYADGAVTTHNSDTTDVHGIADTSALATTSATASAISTAVSDHNSDTTSVHGIADTSVLETTSGAQSKADTAVSTHNDDTTNIHGIADTSLLATKSYADDAEADAITAAEGYTDTAIGALTKTSVGLGNVDNTSDSSKPVSTATQTALDDKLDLAGGELTGALILHGDPSLSLQAATKQYVDNTASGVVAKPQVLAATSTNLAATYNNGTAGVGGTLTHTSNGAWPTTVAGATGWVIGSGLLVKNQTNKEENGRYYLSDLGSVSTPWVLTRCGYCDEADEIPGAYIFVQGGTLAGTGWIQVVADPATFVVGTDDINVFQFSGSGTITAGTNISVSGNEVSVVATPSLSGVAFSDGTQTKEGVPSRTPIIAKTDSYTLSALTERDSLIEVAKSTATTITIPTDATLNFPIGTSLDILQTSTGQVTIAGAGGVTVNATPGLKLRTTWSSCTLFKRAANTWVVYGDLTA